MSQYNTGRNNPRSPYKNNNYKVNPEINKIRIKIKEYEDKAIESYEKGNIKKGDEYDKKADKLYEQNYYKLFPKQDKKQKIQELGEVTTEREILLNKLDKSVEKRGLVKNGSVDFTKLNSNEKDLYRKAERLGDKASKLNKQIKKDNKRIIKIK
ncbi:MAG: hypothetical protein ACQERX_02110 [Bacillota bacterium]